MSNPGRSLAPDQEWVKLLLIPTLFTFPALYGTSSTDSFAILVVANILLVYTAFVAVVLLLASRL